MFAIFWVFSCKVLSNPFGALAPSCTLWMFLNMPSTRGFYVNISLPAFLSIAEIPVRPREQWLPSLGELADLKKTEWWQQEYLSHPIPAATMPLPNRVSRAVLAIHLLGGCQTQINCLWCLWSQHNKAWTPKQGRPTWKKLRIYFGQTQHTTPEKADPNISLWRTKNV